MHSASANSQDLSDIRPTRHNGSSLAIHPYFGKVDPALASSLISRFSAVGDTVLDPFCGSGTVIHESLTMGRNALGWDSSPLSGLLATAKTIGIYEGEDREMAGLVEDLHPYISTAGYLRKPLPAARDIPPMPRIKDITMWFGNHALNELGYLRGYLTEKGPELSSAARILVTTAFSRIIVAASNQQGESSYRRIEKADYEGRVVDLFLRGLHAVSVAAGAFRSLMSERQHRNRTSLAIDNGDYEVQWGDIAAKIETRDTRAPYGKSKEGLAVDLVVTSPPYLMSWDYGLYHKLRFYWLGFDLNKYEETEIGRHLRRKNDDVERYRSDMKSSFQSMAMHLKPDACVAMINAPSIVYGTTVDTNQILAECAASAGLKLVTVLPTLDIPGPHHGMYASLEARGTSTAGASGKKEHVLIFRRD